LRVSRSMLRRSSHPRSPFDGGVPSSPVMVPGYSSVIPDVLPWLAGEACSTVDGSIPFAEVDPAPPLT